MKAFKHFFVFLFLLFPCAVLAAEVPGIDKFLPPISDLSVSYLGQIFGSIGGLLPATSGQLLGGMFKIFNNGILAIAVVFLTYAATRSILDTAQNGEMMKGGQGRSNPAWMGLRAALGIGLLVPKYSGYSVIQWVVMWVVIHGVGLADTAWKNALEYVETKAPVYTPPQPISSDLVKMVGSAFSNQVCMFKAQQIAQNRQQDASSQLRNNPGNPFLQQQADKVVSGFAPIWDNHKKVVYFPGMPNMNLESDSKAKYACGEISWAGSDEGTKRNALEQVVLAVEPAAEALVRSTDKDENAQQLEKLGKAALVGAAADYMNITLPVRSKFKAHTHRLIKNELKKAESQGWIMAGRYYRAMTSVQVTIDKSATNLKLKKLKEVPSKWEDARKAGISGTQKQLQELASDVATSKTWITGAAKAAGDVSEGARSINLTVGPDWGTEAAISAGAVASFGPAALPLMAAMGVVDVYMVAWKNALNAGGDPIVKMYKLGRVLMNTAASIWGVTAGVLMAGTAAAAGADIFGIPAQIIFVFAGILIVPIIIAITVPLFAAGGVMLVYVPLIPYIIFTFAALGWMFAVLEAMVAAPLVALGFTHPEGHDLMGKSEQAVMLLLSVFVRPVLMIIGFVAAMIMSFVALSLLNTGFVGIIQDWGITTPGSGLNVGGWIIATVVYAGLVMVLINQVFSLVTLVPERTMRWIGGQAVSGGREETSEALRGSRQGAQEAGSKQAEAAHGSLKTASDYGMKSTGPEAGQGKGDK